MKPKIIPDKFDPFKVDPVQLKDLDQRILESYPKAQICEGVKYMRHATIDFGSEFCSTLKNSEIEGLALGICVREIAPEDFEVDNNYHPDHYFHGKIMGSWRLIFMWGPFFN